MQLHGATVGASDMSFFKGRIVRSYSQHVGNQQYTINQLDLLLTSMYHY
jgi:hypothetical protein